MNAQGMSMGHMRIAGKERRGHRRHDLDTMGITVQRWDPSRKSGRSLGRIVDLSAGGVRIRTDASGVKPEAQIRVRMELPAFAGISPFVETQGDELAGKRQWVGWMSVTRVQKIGSEMEISGRLVDMNEMDRSMLGLYLSTQPLAA
jgi:hypothetical protein